MPDSVPLVDLGAPNAPALIDLACRSAGFVALAGHGISADHREELFAAARQFFALRREAKERVSLAAGGRAWRGWFPLGGELTSGVPDLKEGFYVGREEPPSAIALHGPNVWPAEVPELAELVLTWMASMEALGQRVLTCMAQGLGLGSTWFREHLTTDPTVLFRIFTYPPHRDGAPHSDTSELDGAPGRWGVGEHTDYGLVTMLVHDGTPGLEVWIDGPGGGTWVDAPSDPDLVICNIGDMLDRLTGGRYRSTPHRVRNHTGHDRISLPFFLDPSWTASIEPLPLDAAIDPVPPGRTRWDGADLGAFAGTYGDWLTAKVAKVFPALAHTVL